MGGNGQGSSTPAGNGTTNRGGGGGGARSNYGGGRLVGYGGSGIVILKYPDSRTITIGAGLTGTTAPPAGGFKVTTITQGTGNVSFA